MPSYQPAKCRELLSSAGRSWLVSKGWRYSQHFPEIEDAAQDVLIWIVASRGADVSVSHAIMTLRSKLKDARKSEASRHTREGQYARIQLPDDLLFLLSGNPAPLRRTGSSEERSGNSWIDDAIGRLAFPMSRLARDPKRPKRASNWDAEPIVSVVDDEDRSFYAQQGLDARYADFLEGSLS
jgi:hypothetical protein